MAKFNSRDLLLIGLKGEKGEKGDKGDPGDGNLSEYQKKTDNTLETNSNEIVGAINEVQSYIGLFEGIHEKHESELQDHNDRIIALEENGGGGSGDLNDYVKKDEVTISAIANKIVSRTVGGNIMLPSSAPNSEYYAVRKGYVDGEVKKVSDKVETKLDKITEPNEKSPMAYVINPDGSQGGIAITNQGTANTIAMTDVYGRLGCASPSASWHVATKKYVDDLVASAGGKLYRHDITAVLKAGDTTIGEYLFFVFSSESQSYNSSNVPVYANLSIVSVDGGETKVILGERSSDGTFPMLGDVAPEPYHFDSDGFIDIPFEL